VHGAGGKLAAVADRPRVGRQFDRDAARAERRRQRLGREQVAAGSAGGEQDDGRDWRVQAGLPAAAKSGAPASIGARGRPRLSASSIPMP
jgi:hypothetical protein